MIKLPLYELQTHANSAHRGMFVTLSSLISKQPQYVNFNNQCVQVLCNTTMNVSARKNLQGLHEPIDP